MMRFMFTCGALWALYVDKLDVALVYAALAVAWSISSNGWLSREWQDAKIRNAIGNERSIFSGRRDD